MSISSLSTNMELPLYANNATQPIKEKGIRAEGEENILAQKTTAEEFLEFAQMNPAERMRAAYLKDNNMSEEELAAMPKEERDKIEEEIRQMIEKKIRAGVPEQGAGIDIQA